MFIKKLNTYLQSIDDTNYKCDFTSLLLWKFFAHSINLSNTYIEFVT